MFALLDAENIDLIEEINVSASGDEPEELLHAWLCELLARFNVEGFVGRLVTGFHTEIKGVLIISSGFGRKTGCGERGSSLMFNRLLKKLALARLAATY